MGEIPAAMEWLKDHIEEVILPNLRGEIYETAGIRLDPSMGDFKVFYEALDEDDDDCEEFEITISIRSVTLVDACFLVEEIESGVLPFVTEEPEDLRHLLIEAKLAQLREKVIPLVLEDLEQQLSENEWDPKLAKVLTTEIEAPENFRDRRGVAGYPPFVLTLRHPHYDPDAFEVAARIDPIKQEEIVDWKTVMARLDSSLKAIGEEKPKDVAAPPSSDSSDPDEGEEDGSEESSASEGPSVLSLLPGLGLPRPTGPSLGSEDGPTAADLADAEIAEIEEELQAEDEGKEAAPPLPTGLLERLEESLGFKLKVDPEALEPEAKKKAAKKKSSKKSKS